MKREASLPLFTLVFTLAISILPLPMTARAQSGAKLQDEGRGLQVQAGKSIQILPVDSKRYALVIGVDDYQDTQINRLEGASNDAKAIVEALVLYAGFPRDQVVLLTSDQPVERRPTRGNILRRLSNLRSVVPKDGLLLLAFAGHGIERGEQAYLLPSDAQLSGDISLLEDTAINVEEMRRRITQTGVGQVLMILDACRNDPAAGRGDADNRMTKTFTQAFNFEERNNAVTAFATLYATDVGNRAYEYKEKKQGYFTWALVEALKGAAANTKGEVTLNGLINYLQDAVPKRISIDLGPGKVQKPYAIIQGYKASDLVLAKIPVADVAPAPALDPAARERGEWDKVQLAGDPAALRDFLKRFPKGAFTEQATWELIRNSKNPDDFKNYLKNFPNGRNAALAALLAEDALWGRIQNSKVALDYQQYLKEYPNGRYAELAVRRIQPPPAPRPSVDTAPLKPEKKVLVVLANAPGANIAIRPRDPSARQTQGAAIDGKFRVELPAGLYDIEVSAAKYSPKRIEGLKLDRDEAIPVELTPLFGSIQIGPVEPDASVWIDDKRAANVSVKREERLMELTEIPAGRHKLKIVQAGLGEWSREVEVEGGKTRYVPTEFKAALVSLTVRTEPEAEVYVDDSYAGRANERGELKIANVAPGQRKIQAKKNEFEPAERVQALSAGSAELRLDLKRVSFSPEFVDEFIAGAGSWDAPKAWQASPGKLKVAGAGIGLIKDYNYKDFKMVFDLSFANGKGAVWVLRGQNENTFYLFQLTGPNSSMPNVFRTFIYQNGQAKLLKLLRVPENLSHPGDKFTITVEARASEIKHFIQLKSNPKATQPQPFSVTTDNTFSHGRIGFGAIEGEEFIVQFVSIIPMN